MACASPGMDTRRRREIAKLPGQSCSGERAEPSSCNAREAMFASVKSSRTPSSAGHCAPLLAPALVSAPCAKQRPRTLRRRSPRMPVWMPRWRSHPSGRRRARCATTTSTRGAGGRGGHLPAAGRQPTGPRYRTAYRRQRRKHPGTGHPPTARRSTGWAASRIAVRCHTCRGIARWLGRRLSKRPPPCTARCCFRSHLRISPLAA